jgi:hypothetical protein
MSNALVAKKEAGYNKARHVEAKDFLQRIERLSIPETKIYRIPTGYQKGILTVLVA